MSDTPRTDAAEADYQEWMKYAKRYGHLPEAMECAPAAADPFTIARELERELAACQEKAAGLAVERVQAEREWCASLVEEDIAAFGDTAAGYYLRKLLLPIRMGPKP